MKSALAFPGTFSKSPLAWGFEDDLAVNEASGCHLALSDGVEYIDWVSGLGSNLLGYGFIKELASVVGSVSLPHRLEHVVANRLSDLLRKNIIAWNSITPLVRFGKTGSDVTTCAIRLARAVTEKEGIITMAGGYHGWHDWTIARSQPAYGVLPTERQFITEAKYNDINSLYAAHQRLNGRVAAVIIEQPLEAPEAHFYSEVRAFCDKLNIIFIMDEIVTGLRYGLGGICGLYGIKPDLVCMGKGLANGFPLSALIGRPELMERFSRIDPVFCSSTMWGESVGLAAASYVLSTWDEHHIAHIWEVGVRLITGLTEAGWEVIGDPARNLLVFSSPNEQAFFIHGMREKGILMNRPNFPTVAHKRLELQQTLDAAIDVRKELDKSDLNEVTEDNLPRVLFGNR